MEDSCGTKGVEKIKKNPVHKRRENKKLENYTAVSLTSFLRIKPDLFKFKKKKPTTTFEHYEDNKELTKSLYTFFKNKSNQTKLFSSSDRVIRI